MPSNRRKHPDRLTGFELLMLSKYVRHGNATRAYKEAGGTSGKHADAQAAKVMAKPPVRKWLKEYQEHLNTNAIAQGREIQETLTGFLRDHEVAHVDRIRSANVLGKMQHLFSEKREFTGTVQHEHTHSIKLPSREDALLALRVELKSNPTLRSNLRLMLDEIEHDLALPA